MENTLENLIEQLRSRKVRFQFVKKDGTTREAIGTTNTDLLPAREKREHIGPQKRGVVTFYDFVADGWRCFQENSNILILD